MELTIRSATNKDIAECVRVEKASIKGLAYLEDVWDYFGTTKGELTCTLLDGKICGVGKFTVLPDNTAWLETLRVDEEYQGRGLGKAIYKRYFEQAEEFSCSAMAMYTGISNVVSAGLARKNGFEKTAEFRGYVLENFSEGSIGDFEKVDAKTAWEIISPTKDTHGSHLVMNRTFYRFNQPNVEWMADNDMVYLNEKTGSFIVCGARFQHNLALHIPIMGGALADCLELAKAVATYKGVPKIICTFPLPNEKVENFLIESGFQKEKSDLIVMDINL